ncbi:hypothetical protein CHUAL_004080 [Chamberlinius hualienensis]
MNRTLRKRKYVGTPPTNNSKADSSNNAEPPTKKIANDEEVKVIDEVKVLEPVSESVTKPAADSLKVIEEATEESKPVEEVVKEPEDPYAFMSEADRKLMQTDIVEFLKRFTPRYFVPVYRTWSIPKSAVKHNP